MPDRAGVSCNVRQARRLRKLANQVEEKRKSKKVPEVKEDTSYSFNLNRLVLFRPDISTYPLYAEGGDLASQFYTDVGSSFAGTETLKNRSFSYPQEFSSGYVIPKLDLFVRVHDETSWTEDGSITINRETIGIVDFVGNPVPKISSSIPITSGLCMLDNILVLDDDQFSEYFVRDKKYAEAEGYTDCTFACSKRARSSYHREDQLFINAYYETDSCGGYVVVSRDLSLNETTTKDVIDSTFRQSYHEKNGLDNYNGYDRIYDYHVLAYDVNYAARYRHGPGCGLMMTRKDYGVHFISASNTAEAMIDICVPRGFTDAVQMNNDYEVTFSGDPVCQNDWTGDYNTYNDNYIMSSACTELRPFPNVVWLNAFWVDVEYVKTGIEPQTHIEGVHPPRALVTSLANVKSMGVDNTSSFSFCPWLYRNPTTGTIESIPGRQNSPWLGMFKYMKDPNCSTQGWHELAYNQWNLYGQDDNALTPEYTIMYAFPIFVRQSSAETEGQGRYFLVDRFTPRQIAAQEEEGKYTTTAAEKYQVLCCGYVIPNTDASGKGIAATAAGATVLNAYDITTTSRSAISSATLTTADQVSEPGANETIIPYVHSVTCDSSGELVVTMKYLHFNTGSSTVLASVTGSGDTSTINYLSNLDDEGEE